MDEESKDENISELKSQNIIVWAQKQEVIEQNVLSRLQFLTSGPNPDLDEDIEDGEVGNDCSEEVIYPTNSKSDASGISNINKYLESQAQLQNVHVIKKDKHASDKSETKNCKKSSDLQLRKPKLRIGSSSKRKKKSKIFNTDCDERSENDNSDSDYIPTDECETDDSSSGQATNCFSKSKRKRVFHISSNKIENKVEDDGLLPHYKIRLHNLDKSELFSQEEELIQDNLKIPKLVWDKLYSYQKDGVKWLWNIHQQTVGGLLGDEMGLGKTVQVIVFLAALEYSKIKESSGCYCGLGPTIIVCPATVIHQWVRHFHEWWPPFRVVLLHQSGSYTGDKIQLINDINKSNGVIITTYESILKYKNELIEKKWHYLVLDEGHKIRNPNAKITVTLKQFHTFHKLILTGSPMQNNLQELWSLYDFIVPGKLGSLQAFMEYFVTPIVQGGYANATPTQETTGLLIATSLKNLISPFLLRRTKDEVKDNIYLPHKNEQVLFCSLTEEQKDLYRGYLLSDHVGGILGRTKRNNFSENQNRAHILLGIMTLRKICNHPDLYLGEAEETNATNNERMLPENVFGHYKRSGKMIVVAELLKMWKRQGHRVLLFTQTKAMIAIFEDFLSHHEYKYLKMDGVTTVAHRPLIIDTFNKDTSYDVFLLTTRVGGLGVNLTGANRVIIYDPDWNPATDTQARERAWRIGQLKQVTIYRLVSAGTIEEKMYQRQVWKQLLSNKILIDPKTRRFFNTSDLSDLFSLQEHVENSSEEANIFKDYKVKLDVNEKCSTPDSSTTFSKNKIEAMKTLAREIASKMSKNESKSNAICETVPNRPTPAEILAANRRKLIPVEEEPVNKLDDHETNCTFADTLKKVAERTTSQCTKERKQSHIKKSSVKKKNGEHTVKVDESGKIDGKKIEFLVKREAKKRIKTKNRQETSQDDYVLEKLFSKKGVSTVLQHDEIVQSGRRNTQNLKIHYESKQKADMALKALRKSRISNWTW